MNSNYFSKLGYCLIALIAIVGNLSAQDNPIRGKNASEKSAPAEKKPTEGLTEKLTDEAKPVVRVSTDSLLPATTKAWFSIPDTNRLLDEFKGTDLGKLADKQELKPFVDEMKKRFDEFMEDKNVRLGITLDDVREVGTGEFCIAGVLENTSADVKGAHGLVLLADVSGNTAKAEELLEKVNKQMESLGAKRDTKVDAIAGVEVKKWIVPRVKDPKLTFETYQTIVDGWLVATDNKSVLRDILLRIKNDNNVQALRRLSDVDAFIAIQDRVKAEGLVAEIRWFLEPFGYIDLAQAMRDEETILRKRNDDYPRKLRDNGFDTLKGVGGIVAINKFEYDIAYRTFAFTSANNVQGELRKRALEILDFRNVKKDDLHPWNFISTDYSSHFAMTWNILKAYDNVGPVVDIFGGDDFFKSFEKSFIDDLKINLREMISRLGSRVSVVSATKQPLNNDSERMAIIIPLVGSEADGKKFFGDLKKAIKSGTVKNENGIDFIEDSRESAEVDPESELALDPFKQFEDEPKEKEEGKKGKEINLFQKRFFAIVNNHLVIASHQDVLVDFARGAASKPLAGADDYKYVEEVLSRFVNLENASFREFGRLERELKNNYESFRQNRMGQSETALGRLLNQMFSIESEDPNYVREQKFDGSSLPQDFDGVVAPFLGYSGWALETQADGWLISGGVIKKKGVDEIVEKLKSSERR